MRDGVKIRLEVLHVRGRVNRGKEEDIISVENELHALKEREGGQLVHLMKRRGPRMEPWGTPEETGQGVR